MTEMSHWYSRRIQSDKFRNVKSPQEVLQASISRLLVRSESN